MADATADPARLRALVGPVLPVRVERASLRLVALGPAFPAEFDLNAAGQPELDRVARRHGLAALRPDRAARTKRHGAAAARLAAGTAASRVLHPLEIAEKRHRIGAGAAEMDRLPQTAAIFAGTT